MMKSEMLELVDEHKPFKAQATGIAQILECSIDIGPKRVPLRISVPDREARLSEIVPLAQAICNLLTETAAKDLKRNNTPITCKKGCSACCHYLVALSLPEIDYLQEVLSQMPADYHRAVLQTCLESSKKILHDNTEKPEMTENTDLVQLSRWYAGLNLPCPFLSDGCCEIYEHRPLACREYIVTNSPRYCQPGHEIEPEIVTSPVSVLEALGQLTAEFEQSQVEAVILPLAFISTDDSFERSGQTWPAIELVQRFVRIIEQSAARHYQPLTT